jgi:hypothetical protein
MASIQQENQNNESIMERKRLIEKDPALKKDDLIVITGGGDFIGSNLALYFKKKGFTRIRAVDKKPLYEWYLKVSGVESLCLDVSNETNCHRVCEGAVESITSPPTWAAWDSSNAFAWNVSAAFSSTRT